VKDAVTVLRRTAHRFIAEKAAYAAEHHGNCRASGST